jgi:hypothetical protein
MVRTPLPAATTRLQPRYPCRLLQYLGERLRQRWWTAARSNHCVDGPVDQNESVGCAHPGANARSALVTQCSGLPKKSSPALGAAQKPYYCGSKYPHFSAVLPRRPCLALHRRALPVHLLPTTGKHQRLSATGKLVASLLVCGSKPESNITIAHGGGSQF